VSDGYEWSALSVKQADDWAVLVAAILTADGIDERYTAEQLVEELTGAGFEPSLDTVAVRHRGELVGYGRIRQRDGLNDGRVRIFLEGGVHPEYRRRGIGTALMSRLEDRARAAASERNPGVPLVFGASGGLEGDPVRPMLEARGYECVRYFQTMRRELPGEQLPEPAVPVTRYDPGFSLRLLAAHNDAFSTHFGFAPMSELEWQHDLDSVTFRPEGSMLGLAADGRVEAYVMTNCFEAGTLYISRVGTITSARGRGLARACLLAVLRAGVAAGYRDVKLDVDSINPTGAGALYESVGFRPDQLFATYDKRV
jgi:mycothiol synthase